MQRFTVYWQKVAHKGQHEFLCMSVCLSIGLPPCLPLLCVCPMLYSIVCIYGAVLYCMPILGCIVLFAMDMLVDQTACPEVPEGQQVKVNFTSSSSSSWLFVRLVRTSHRATHVCSEGLFVQQTSLCHSSTDE